ncbi:MAG TPA: hypothetical protein VH183_10755 [Burkholderiaceae bacterium]|nr:hypothetical protein [Burkholderiaceae bacterium]
MKRIALCLLVLCTTLAGCVVVPEGHWFHDRDHEWHDHEWHDHR